MELSGEERRFLSEKKVSLGSLFITFAKMGVMTFGGGYAMLPILQREVVENKRWATEEEIMDYFAIGQCTPGIIAVNTATFIGYKVKGVVGAIVSTLGVVCPSVIIITLIAACLTNFQDIPVVQHALAGIRISVCVLMAVSIYNLGKKSVNTLFGISLCLAGFIFSYFTNVSIVLLVIIAGICGVLQGRIGK